MKTLEIGDVTQLKSGGPLLTVVGLVSVGSPEVTVNWLTERNELGQVTLHVCALRQPQDVIPPEDNHQLALACQTLHAIIHTLTEKRGVPEPRVHSSKSVLQHRHTLGLCQIRIRQLRSAMRLAIKDGMLDTSVATILESALEQDDRMVSTETETFY